MCFCGSCSIRGRAPRQRKRRSPDPLWSRVSWHWSRGSRPRQAGCGPYHLLVLSAWGQFGDQAAILLPLLCKLYGLKDKEQPPLRPFVGVGPTLISQGHGGWRGRWRWGPMGEGQGQDQGQGQWRCWDSLSAPQAGAGRQERCRVARKASGPEWAPWCSFPRPPGPHNSPQSSFSRAVLTPLPPAPPGHPDPSPRATRV